MPWDQYFTPDWLARRLAMLVPAEAARIVDPACGDGALLRAVDSRIPAVSVGGVDLDRQVIGALRRTYPAWTLSTGNIFNDASIQSTAVARAGTYWDAAILNPPYTGRRQVEHDGRVMLASAALAYLIRTVQIFKPRLCVAALLPESLFVAEADSEARSLLRELGYRMNPVEEVPAEAFRGPAVQATRGANVRTWLAIVETAAGAAMEEEVRYRWQTPIMVSPVLTGQLVRGGLPVHEARQLPGDTPFLHTRASSAPRRVSMIQRGVVSGPVVLFPRVGVPTYDRLSARLLDPPAQLSDCLLALVLDSEEQSRAAQSLIQGQFESLVSLYRGTCARYVTVKRLKDWLATIGIATQIVVNSEASHLGLTRQQSS